jgi:hypothetical protein
MSSTLRVTDHCLKYPYLDADGRAMPVVSLGTHIGRLSLSEAEPVTASPAPITLGSVKLQIKVRLVL